MESDMLVVLRSSTMFAKGVHVGFAASRNSNLEYNNICFFLTNSTEFVFCCSVALLYAASLAARLQNFRTR